MNCEEKMYPSNANTLKIERDTVDHGWTTGGNQQDPGVLVFGHPVWRSPR